MSSSFTLCLLVKRQSVINWWICTVRHPFSRFVLCFKGFGQLENPETVGDMHINLWELGLLIKHLYKQNQPNSASDRDSPHRHGLVKTKSSDRVLEPVSTQAELLSSAGHIYLPNPFHSFFRRISLVLYKHNVSHAIIHGLFVKWIALALRLTVCKRLWVECKKQQVTGRQIFSHAMLWHILYHRTRSYIIVGCKYQMLSRLYPEMISVFKSNWDNTTWDK